MDASKTVKKYGQLMLKATMPGVGAIAGQLLAGAKNKATEATSGVDRRPSGQNALQAGLQMLKNQLQPK